MATYELLAYRTGEDGRLDVKWTSYTVSAARAAAFTHMPVASDGMMFTARPLQPGETRRRPLVGISPIYDRVTAHMEAVRPRRKCPSG
jgi:hypothetical protein